MANKKLGAITSAQTEKQARKFARLVPTSRDVPLVILKGHLLIEEQIERIIVANVKDPEPLEDARLTFHQKLCLARALCGKAFAEEFLACQRLNGIRNDCAHQLKPPSVNRKIDEFVSFGSREFKGCRDNRQRARYLRNVIVNVCAFLSGCAEMMEWIKTDEYKKELKRRGIRV